MLQKAPYEWMMASSARESLCAQGLELEGWPAFRKLPKRFFQAKNSRRKECEYVERAAFLQLVEDLKAQLVENALWIP